MERRSDRHLSALDGALNVPSASSQTASDARVWRVDPQALTYRAWDDDLVVHNDATGHTHHLGPLGRLILFALLERPAGLQAADFLSHLQHGATSPERDAALQEVQRTLDELADLELISCVPA